MNRQQVLEAIEKIATRHLGRPGKLKPEMDLVEDLELDSLLLLTLAVEVENHFEICLEQEEEAGIRTVDNLVEIVLRKTSERSEAKGAT
jgi:acyl carrier protein